ncbi:MAG: hypothetical protein ACRD2B_08520 [Terriglobia bacterium]
MSEIGRAAINKHLIVALLCVNLIAIWPVNVHGQNTAPEAELFGGVTKVWGNANGSKFDDGGGEISATGYFNRFFGVEAKFDKFSYAAPSALAYGSHFGLLFGPHFAYHGNSWINPLAHILVGFTRGDAIGPAFQTINHTGFTWGIGGGVDVKIWRFLWLRPIQADYLRESFPGDPNPPFPFSRALENNLQLATGFTLHLGRLRSGGGK